MNGNVGEWILIGIAISILGLVFVVYQMNTQPQAIFGPQSIISGAGTTADLTETKQGPIMLAPQTFQPADGLCANIPLGTMGDEAQTLSIDERDYAQRGTAVSATITNSVYKDVNAPEFDDTTTSRGTKYAVYTTTTGATFFGSLYEVITPCSDTSPQLNVLNKKMDTAMTASARKSDGSTADADTATGQTAIGSGATANYKIRLTPSGKYLFASGQLKGISCWINASNVSDWDSGAIATSGRFSSTTGAIAGVTCVPTAYPQPSNASIGGQVIAGFDCPNADITGVNTDDYELSFAMVAAGGIDAGGTGNNRSVVTCFGHDYYTGVNPNPNINSGVGGLRYGPVKDNGQTIQTRLFGANVSYS